MLRLNQNVLCCSFLVKNHNYDLSLITNISITNKAIALIFVLLFYILTIDFSYSTQLWGTEQVFKQNIIQVFPEPTGEKQVFLCFTEKFINVDSHISIVCHFKLQIGRHIYHLCY